MTERTCQLVTSSTLPTAHTGRSLSLPEYMGWDDRGGGAGDIYNTREARV